MTDEGRPISGTIKATCTKCKHQWKLTGVLFFLTLKGSVGPVRSCGICSETFAISKVMEAKT